MATASEKNVAVVEEHTPNHLESNAELDIDDPHIAASKLDTAKAEWPPVKTLLAIFFLSFGNLASVECGFVLPAAIVAIIGNALHDTTRTLWITAAWTAAGAISFSLAGSLSDIFGRRPIVLFGSVLALIGAIVGATAQKLDAVIAASSILGFASGFTFVSYTAVPELLPFKYRAMGLAFLEFVLIVPFGIAGPIIAYRWVQISSWRVPYYLSIGTATVSIIGLFLFYKPPSRPQKDFDKSRWQQTKELDWVGILLLTAGLTIFLVGVSWAGRTGHPWKSASVIAPIVVGFFVFCCTFVWSFTIGPENAIFPKRLFFRFRAYSVYLILNFVGGMNFLAMISLLPQCTLYIFTNDPIQIGLYALPRGIGNFVGCCVLPAMIHKFKRIRLQLLIGFTFQTVFTAAQAWAVPQRNKWAFMMFQTLGQFAYIWITICAMTATGLNVNQKDFGRAVGIVGTFRSTGGAVGTAIYSTIVNSLVSSHLGANVAAAAIRAGLAPSSVASLIPALVKYAFGAPAAVFRSVPGITPAIQAVAIEAYKQTYIHAFKIMFLSTLAVNVMAFCFSFFAAEVSQYFTNAVSVHLENDPAKAREEIVPDVVEDRK